MDKIQIKSTIFFDGTFWIGIFERVIDNELQVAKYTFGSEPKDVEIYFFILNNYGNLIFSNSVYLDNKQKQIKNKKRMQKQVKIESSNYIGTKSQQALKIYNEEKKLERKKISKQNKQIQMKIKFNLKNQKKKEKHKGR